MNPKDEKVEREGFPQNKHVVSRTVAVDQHLGVVGQERLHRDDGFQLRSTIMSEDTWKRA